MKSLLSFIFILLLTLGCKEKYNPPVTSPQTGYLVVEGFINNGSQPTVITLSRTTQLENNSGVAYETGAQVSIEGDGGDTYALHQTGAGTYNSDVISLNPAGKYRLHILTQNSSEYVSDYTPVKTTPPVDSLNWERNNGDLQIYINSHDPQNNTKYYQWQYEETWEYHSAYYRTLVYITDPATSKILRVGYRDSLSASPDTSIYKCWHTVPSTSIVIGSSEKLTSDHIHLPVINIKQSDQKLSVLYRVQLRQFAVSSNKYQFLQRMKKNTESVGSIFDAQPSELNTNIHCLSDPSEQVIGYMEVSQAQEKILFISNSQVSGWNYSSGCAQYEFLNNPDSINSKASGYFPTTVASVEGFNIKTFYASEPHCVDCTLTGTNVRPDFWP